MPLNVIDRFALQVAPKWGEQRLRARVRASLLQRHYEAAQHGPRTDSWIRRSTDANRANGPSLSILRDHARDLVRNNGWPKRAKQIIGNHVVGWGITPTPYGAGPRTLKRARALWKAWAESTQCDVEGKRNIYGLQRLAVETVAESGEVLVRRYYSTKPGLAIPLQLQVLEPDFIDTHKDNLPTDGGGRIIQGVEYDADGAVVAYWLFRNHPGAASTLFGGGRWTGAGVSERVPAADVAHIFRHDRPGQARGVTWFAAAIALMKNFDVFEEAELVQQQMAACLVGAVTDVDGTGVALDPEKKPGDINQLMEPGTFAYFPVGKEVKFTTPPSVTNTAFGQRQLRKFSASMNLTYEDVSGDYSQVNFSSARMSRLSHWASVHDWQWNMAIPQMCDRVYAWMTTAALIAGTITETPSAEWTTQPMPITDPDKEVTAMMKAVRVGAAQPDDIPRLAGRDPDVFWPQYANQLLRLDDLGIVLDSDSRKRTQLGMPTTLMKGPKK